MACPSGCVNGGALLKSDDKNVKAKDLASVLLMIMTDLTTKTLYPSSSDSLAENLRKVSDKSQKGEDGPILDLSASFQAIEKSLQSQLKW